MSEIENLIASIEEERRRRELKEGFCAYRKKHLRGTLCTHPYAIPGVPCSKVTCPIFNRVYASLRYGLDGKLHLRVKRTDENGKPIREDRTAERELTRELIEEAANLLPERLREIFLRKAKALAPDLF